MSTAPKTRRIHPGDIVYALLAVLVIVIVLEIWPANSYMLLPGDAIPVQTMISVQGHPPPKGHAPLFMTDVSLYRVHHMLEEIYGRLNPNATLEPVQDVQGTMTSQEYNRFSQDAMADSQLSAKIAALRAAGYHIGYPPVEVAGTIKGTPAARVLRAGDVILAVDGHAITTEADIARVLHRITPGTVVHLLVRRQGARLRLSVRTVGSTNGKISAHGKNALIGVYVHYGTPSYTLPLNIRINAGSISGPSAGLMFALGIVEDLERRDLAHGCKVAGTGEIALDGTVGPIGGAKQKIIAARNAGAKYFLVPDSPDNVQAARANRGSIQVVPVKSLQQALTFLDHLKPCA